MKMTIHSQQVLNELIKDYPKLIVCHDAIKEVFNVLHTAYKIGGKFLVCGNGGSAADCEHITGELMKEFMIQRPLNHELKRRLLEFEEDGAYMAGLLQGAISCIALTNHNALSTAFANDTDPKLIFAQQVIGYGNEKDVLWAISTSGNAENVYYAAIAAKAKGMKVVSLTGQAGGKLRTFSDVCICVPADKNYKIQEYHLPVYHALCAMLESEIFMP